MEKITCDQLQDFLDEITSCDAFEIHRGSGAGGKHNFYIPYMMNDALECYLMLKNGRMTGEYLADCKEEMYTEVVETENGLAAICHQGTENVFTVWFEECFRDLQCYRYDQIGHFWIKGEEHWRRLVYIVGTIHDKYNYMGDSVCNEAEKELMPLMEFAPFRYFSPIHDSLDEYYADSEKGLECMEQLVKEAGDRGYLRLLRLYRMAVSEKSALGRAQMNGRFRFPAQVLSRILAKALMSPKRNKLYQLIFEKVQDASMQYAERKYQEHVAAEIQNAREEICSQMQATGFSGRYPLFEKVNGKRRMEVLAMEEHPFTVLESEQFRFRIQFMVSETNAAHGTDGQTAAALNAGFFRKRGNHGWIAKDLNAIVGAINAEVNSARGKK